jgi:hypothetical protein
LIVPGVSIGPVSLGESQAKVAAIAGPEHHIVSQGNMVHDYPDLQLYVVYNAGRVVEIGLSLNEAEPNHLAYAYVTRTNLGLDDEFTRWRIVYPTAPCKTRITKNEPPLADSDNVTCLATGAHGNFTVFLFTALEPKTPVLEGISVASKSMLAIVQTEGAP